MADDTTERIAGYLRTLTQHPDRHVGSEGNRAATAWFAEVIASHGFEVERVEFECIEWRQGDASLAVGGERFGLLPGPYSLPAAVSAPLRVATTVEDIEAGGHEGAVLLLRGEVASGQLMPKNFTFYNPESHQRIIAALETASPAAVVAATGRDPGLAGSLCPFPLIDDGDFDIPSAYMLDVEGERLAEHAGEVADVRIDSERIPATAEQVYALRTGELPGRIVVFAHIDSKKGSPGALDNGSGVATILALAETLPTDVPLPTIEIVPINGEDNYAAHGEMLWMARNEGRLGDIILGMNVDDAGWRDHITHVSFYGVPEPLETRIRSAMADRGRMAEGPQWFQSDHAILAMSGVPAIALVTSDTTDFMARFAHTAEDTIDLADPSLLAGAAEFLRDVVVRIGESVASRPL